MIKKFFKIVLFAVLIGLALYLVRNLMLPVSVYYPSKEETVINSNTYEVKHNYKWMVTEPDRLVGRAVVEDSNFFDKIYQLVFPNKIYSVYSDDEHVSYCQRETFSEYYFEISLYRSDITLPNLSNITPYRVELGYYDSMRFADAKYKYSDNSELINKVLSILRYGDENSKEYSDEEIEKLKIFNQEYYYNICLFSKDVPGSVYQINTKRDNWRVYIYKDNDRNSEDYIEVTSAILLLIENGNTY